MISIKLLKSFFTYKSNFFASMFHDNYHPIFSVPPYRKIPGEVVRDWRLKYGKRVSVHRDSPGAEHRAVKNGKKKKKTTQNDF